MAICPQATLEFTLATITVLTLEHVARSSRPCDLAAGNKRCKSKILCHLLSASLQSAIKCYTDQTLTHNKLLHLGYELANTASMLICYSTIPVFAWRICTKNLCNKEIIFMQRLELRTPCKRSKCDKGREPTSITTDC
jgi:hypothetical protein